MKSGTDKPRSDTSFQRDVIAKTNIGSYEDRVRRLS